jgi:hypothetical protein
MMDVTKQIVVLVVSKMVMMMMMMIMMMTTTTTMITIMVNDQMINGDAKEVLTMTTIQIHPWKTKVVANEEKGGMIITPHPETIRLQNDVVLVDIVAHLETFKDVHADNGIIAIHHRQDEEKENIGMTTMKMSEIRGITVVEEIVGGGDDEVIDHHHLHPKGDEG